MADNTRKFNAMINSRYGLPEKDLYNQVIQMAEANNIAKSRAQLILVQKGLEHKDNPHPVDMTLYQKKPKVIIKEKVVIKEKPPIEKVVYKDKIVYKDRPEEHITEHLSELPGATETQLRPAGDQQSNGDETNPGLAIDKKQSSKNSNVGGYIGGLVLAGVVIYSLIKVVTIQ